MSEDKEFDWGVTLQVAFLGEHSYTAEDLYQAIKARLIKELSVDVPGTSHYGILCEDKRS